MLEDLDAMAASVNTVEGTAPANVSFERERGVYALEVHRDVAHAIIEVGEDAGRTGRILRVFSSLSSARVPVFLIKMHRSAVTLAFAGATTELATEVLRGEGLSADIRGGLTLLVVRAASMRDLHGVMTSIADALFDAGARLYETGDSHNSVQCLIEQDSAEAAERQLCARFQLSTDAVSHFSVNVEAAG